MPPSSPSPLSSAVIDPTSKRSSGWAARASPTIRDERSIPKAETPSPVRYAVTLPGPQPTSAVGPRSADVTSSANAPSTARDSGSSSLGSLTVRA